MYISSFVNNPYNNIRPRVDLNTPVPSEYFIEQMMRLFAYPIQPLVGQAISELPAEARDYINTNIERGIEYVVNTATSTHRQFANARMNNPQFDWGLQRIFNSSVNYLINQSGLF